MCVYVRFCSANMTASSSSSPSSSSSMCSVAFKSFVEYKSFAFRRELKAKSLLCMCILVTYNVKMIPCCGSHDSIPLPATRLLYILFFRFVHYNTQWWLMCSICIVIIVSCMNCCDLFHLFSVACSRFQISTNRTKNILNEVSSRLTEITCKLNKLPFKIDINLLQSKIRRKVSKIKCNQRFGVERPMWSHTFLDCSLSKFWGKKKNRNDWCPKSNLCWT